MDDSVITEIVKALITQGDAAMGILGWIVALLTLWFYRKDQMEWRKQTRDELTSSITAMERNTSAMIRLADLLKVRLEKDDR